MRERERERQRERERDRERERENSDGEIGQLLWMSSKNENVRVCVCVLEFMCVKMCDVGDPEFTSTSNARAHMNTDVHARTHRKDARDASQKKKKRGKKHIWHTSHTSNILIRAMLTGVQKKKEESATYSHSQTWKLDTHTQTHTRTHSSSSTKWAEIHPSSCHFQRKTFFSERCLDEALLFGDTLCMQFSYLDVSLAVCQDDFPTAICLTIKC